MKNAIRKIQRVKKLGHSLLLSFRVIILQYLFKFKYGFTAFVHPSFSIEGAKNIEANDLWLGLHYRGYELSSDQGFFNVKGKLKIAGNYAVGKGCRFDIGKKAKVNIGNGGYINSNTTIIITDYLNIGDNCAISWNCQFLDNDFHTIHINQVEKRSHEGIQIGNNVWIGCGVKVYKGVILPNGCVVASDSVVKSKFLEENCLIAGNPAKVIKTNITWK